ELGHVVAPEHGLAQVQQAVAQLVAGLDQRPPRLPAADAVHPQAAPFLEGAHGLVGGVAERAGCVPGSGTAKARQAALQVANGVAPVAPAKGQAGYRNAWSSWRSCPLPLAPMSLSWTSPSLNRMRVGMLMTSNRRATSRFSSTLSLAMRSLPACSVAISSRMGAIILQGPHHSAQKSTRTASSAPLISSSNVASVNVAMLAATGEPPGGMCG